MSGTLSLTFNVSAAPFLVTLPLIGTSVEATIVWGDGNTDTGMLAPFSHTYATNASFTAVITITSADGSVTQFGDPNWQGVGRLTAVTTTDNTTWGLRGATSFYYAFRDAVLLTSVPTNVPSSVTNMQNMFQGATAFNQDISSWNVSGVTTMESMFQESAFNNGDTGNNGAKPLTWTAGSGTSNVTTMNAMFYNATAFNQDISSWNVSKVTNMTYMFFGSIFNNGDPGNNEANPLNWGATDTGTSNVVNMNRMFTAAKVFNQDISLWNVSKVNDMTAMFANSWIFNQNISGWIVSDVTNMNAMFFEARVFNQDVSSWNVSKVTDMTNMFKNAILFNNGDPGNNGANSLNWGATDTGTSLVQNMTEMFYNATAFNQTISTWNVSSVTDMNNMFANATLFNNGAVGDIGVKDLTWTGTGTSISNTMANMFENAAKFNQDVSSWNVSNVTSMYSMFDSAVLFNNGDTGNNGANQIYWSAGTKTSRVTNMGRMFANAAKFNQDISSWNVSSVTNIGSMFNGATLFNNGDTGNNEANPLYWTDGSGTSNVTLMNSVFISTAFNQDITGWNVSGVGNMYGMFNNASLFDQNIRVWVVDIGDTLTDMFLGSTAMTARYSTTDGYASTPSYTFFNQEPPAPPSTLSLTFYVTGVEQEVILPISGTDVLVSVVWGDGTTNTSLNHMYLTGTWTAIVTITGGSVTTFGSSGWTGVARLTGVSTDSLTNWGLPGVSSLAYAFAGASLLVSVPTYLPSSVRNVSYMFSSCTNFNQNISGWNVSLVTTMEGMFEEALFFNKNISTWNVSSVLDMRLMFRNAINFDQNIRVWSVVSPTTLTNMFSGATAMTARYAGTAGYDATPSYTFFNLAPYPCFLEGTQILCLENGREVYRPVQSLRKGDLVKTIYNGFLPVHMIGTTPMYNPNNNDRIASRLYKCPKENYPGLFEDLYITGCHSILVPWLTYEQGQKTIASLGKLYVTDKHCRLMAWVDEKSEPYKMAGVYNIYHIALENNDYYMNYGIYANGLLVESCSKRYLAEISNMRILGEEDCSLTDGVSAEENVFHKMPSLIETC